MKKFIYFDLDDTLVFNDKKLPNNALDLIRNLNIEYGVCTNRPLLGVPELNYLLNIKSYICEGGVVSYDLNKNKCHVHNNAIEVNHRLINKMASDFALENNLSCIFEQNPKRIYTSTLYSNVPLDQDKLDRLGSSILSVLGGSYCFVILNNQKISFTLVGASKHSMISRIFDKETAYFLISDDESVGTDNSNNLNYISINPENSKFNKHCIFVSDGDFEKRLINAILYVINK